jgi:hypothetical protein
MLFVCSVFRPFPLVSAIQKMFGVVWEADMPICKRAETDSLAKFGKETVARAPRRPKWVPHYSAQADSERAQGMLRPVLGIAQDSSGYAQALPRLYSGSTQALLRL